MLFDILRSFLDSLKSEGYRDIIDADSCKGIIFAASNMTDAVLASWYRDVVSEWLNTSPDSMLDCDYDSDDVHGEEEERIMFFYRAFVDILAALCYVRGVVLLPGFYS